MAIKVDVYEKLTNIQSYCASKATVRSKVMTLLPWSTMFQWHPAYEKAIYRDPLPRLLRLMCMTSKEMLGVSVHLR